MDAAYRSRLARSRPGRRHGFHLARVRAVIGLKIEDYYPAEQTLVAARPAKKNGKVNEMPRHHKAGILFG